MGLFDFGKKTRVIKDLSNEVLQLKKLVENNRGTQILENIKANYNRNLAIYPDAKTFNNVSRYCTSDDVFSIITMLARSAAMIPLYDYIVIDEPSNKKLNRILQPHNRPYEVKHLQLKALEDSPEDDLVHQILEKPAEGLSKYEFYLWIYAFLFIDGNAFLKKQRPDEGGNAGLTVSLLPMYPQFVVIKTSNTLPRTIEAYDYIIDGEKVYENIPAEDVIHLKYFNPNMDRFGAELRGLSPLKALIKRNERLDSGMDTSVAQLQNGGVETIVFDKAITGQEVDSSGQTVNVLGHRKDEFYRFLKNPANAGAPYFASGEMGAIQLGLSLANLSVLELANIDFKKLCNAYGVSDVLFNSDSASTESNVKVMEERSYTNAILPNVYMVRDALKAGLLTEFENGRVIEKVNEDGTKEVIRIKGDGIKRELREDISEVSSLQEDMGKKVTWLAAAWWVPVNTKLEMMNLEVIDNPLYDQPLIPTGLQTADDLIMEPNLPIITDDGT